MIYLHMVMFCATLLWGDQTVSVGDAVENQTSCPKRKSDVPIPNNHFSDFQDDFLSLSNFYGEKLRKFYTFATRLIRVMRFGAVRELRVTGLKSMQVNG